MTGVGEEGLRHFNCGGGVAEVGVVLREPLVVVGVVVDLIGQEIVLLHVRVIDRGGGGLMPGGVVEALCLGINMTGHVPHVGDAGGGGPELGRGVEGLGVIAIVPEVDGKVVSWVMRGLGKDLLKNGVEADITLNLNSLAVELPAAADEECFGLQVIGEVEDDILEIADEIDTALLNVLGFFAEEFFVGFEIGFFVIGEGGLLLKFGSLLDKIFGAFFVFPIGQSEPEVGHDTVWVMSENLAERALGFIIPEAVELTDALVEIGLPLVPGSRDGKVNKSGVFHQGSSLAWALIEGVALVGMAGQRIIACCFRRLLSQRKER